MRIERLSKDDRSSFYQTLERYLQPFRRRGISYVMIVHTDTMASVTLSVVGKKGVVQRVVVINKDPIDGWIMVSFGVKYYLVALSEMTTVCRSIVRQAQTLVNKI